MDDSSIADFSSVLVAGVEMDLRIADTAHAAAVAAARQLAYLIHAAVNARGICTLALSGGNTPAAMLRALATIAAPWHAVHLFQVDERVAKRGEPARNLTQLETELLSQVPITLNRIHAMPVEDPDLSRALADYAGALELAAGCPPVLDIVHLGLGVDGHTASLVSGDPALKETQRDVALTQRYNGYRRMTLTFPCLVRARSRVWLTTGPDKAKPFAQLLQRDPGLPGSQLAAVPNTYFVDRAAASKLSKRRA